MDYCKYVDVFYGNGETDHYYSDGLSCKWFYIKALCGNTIPSAVLPFGKLSVCSYSGGYPCGYGTHYPNSCGGIRKVSDTMQVRGISHIHHSGTGAIQYYYNYAITTPFYGDISAIERYYPVEAEQGRPGYYAVTFNGIDCEVTVSDRCAYHHYYFDKPGGRVAVDFSNDGLLRIFGEQYYAFAKDAHIEVTPFGEILFSGVLSGVRLYFCAVAEGVNVRTGLFADGCELGEQSKDDMDVTKPFGGVFDTDGDSVIIKLAYSTIDFDHAKADVRGSIESFDTVMNRAYDRWNKYLSRIEIDTDDEELRHKFYSNLYHSLIKPADMTGEDILGVSGDTVAGLSTLWDQYKTVYPLIFMAYPQMGEKLVKALGNISRTKGRIGCSFGMTDIMPCEEQAKMLGIIALCDGYHYGIPGADASLIEECICRELERDDFKSFIKKGVFERYTHIIDATDACFCASDIVNDSKLKKQLADLGANWIKAYDSDGLMSEKSPYYEGDRYTYSFRLQYNMEDRIALIGDRDRFAEVLDRFFGIGYDSVEQILSLDAYDEIASKKYHRFEGFNNECDMETPYAYIYAGRHDRTCHIIHECVTRAFTTGRGAIPGNNDSGGLSSCFVWNVLGIFPKAGCGEMLMGSPHINNAVIHLADDKHLEIEVHNLNEKNFCVEAVRFNDKPVADMKLPVEALVSGGKLVFEMKEGGDIL